MRFTDIDVNFDLRYEGHQNCPKILSMNILRVFSDYHLWRQNWRQYLWTSSCQFNFFVNLLHSLGVWYFDIWHFFDNMTSFWQLDIFLIFWEQIAHGPHCPCIPLPMWPIPLVPYTPVPLLPMCLIPLYPIPPVGLVAHMSHTPVPHCPCDPLSMWPIPLVPHTPYAPLPIGPISLYPLPIPLVPHTPCAHIAHVPHTPCAPIAHRPHGIYPLYPIPPVHYCPMCPIAHVIHHPCPPLGNGPHR